MFFTFLDYVRRQPKPIRTRYAFLLAASLTTLVATVWFLAGSSTKALTQQSSEVVNSAGPFSQFRSQLKAQWESLQKNDSELGTTTEGVILSSPAEIIISPDTTSSSPWRHELPATRSYREVEIITTSTTASTTTTLD